ncbi:MAG TPA: DUF1902 domain-containing protein [Acidovorax temperans]|nr:DUF1902 domain-containing protein [Acidovorax temperans]
MLYTLQLAPASYTGWMQKPLVVLADWDAEAGVWVATSEDVPGLVTESETLEALSDKLQHLVPELLRANGALVDDEVSYELLARRFSVTQPSRHVN